MKCTFLLCIIFHFFSLTAMDTPWESPYRAIDRIKDFFKKNNNMFNPKPTQLEGPIDEKMVLDTPYLQEILKATQEKKDEASEIMSQFRLYNSNADWAVERSYLAAAALCGGKKGLGRCLESATRAQDFHLCQLLLDHGAKPGTLLAHVRSVKLAELFLAHNASVIMDKDISYCGLLCDVAGSEKYEAGLIPLYRKHGLSPLKGPSPLLALLDSIDGLPSAPSVQEKSILDKAQYLLADLSPKDTLNFLFRYPAYTSLIF